MNELKHWNLSEIRVVPDPSNPQGFKVLGVDGQELASSSMNDGVLTVFQTSSRLVLETREVRPRTEV